MNYTEELLEIIKTIEGFGYFCKREEGTPTYNASLYTTQFSDRDRSIIVLKLITDKLPITMPMWIISPYPDNSLKVELTFTDVSGGWE